MQLDLDDVQPLLAGTVRWETAAACIDLGDEVVRVAGDAAALRAILGDCDGRTSLRQLTERHGRDARDLLLDLLRRGAVVDGEQAWRVLHRHSSVGTALGRPLDPRALAAMEHVTYRPRGVGEVTGLDPADGVAGVAHGTDAASEVALDPAAAASVVALARRRRSTRVGDAPVPATFAALSAVLAAAYGVPSSDDGPRSGTVPSAGGLYPLIVHVLLRFAVGPAGAGLWWFDPATLRLQRLGPGAQEVDALFVPEPSCRALLARGQPVVFLSADLARPSRKYGARGYRYALLEAGAAVEAASLAATELELPLRTIGGIDDTAVHRFLDLPESAVALVALLVGS